MGITYQIPHTARPILTSNIFNAVFNVPTPGKYDFNIAANRNVNVTNLQRGTVYLLERISLSASINESDYLEALEVSPLLYLKRSQSKFVEYKLPLPMVNYVDNQELVLWVRTNKKNDNLILDLIGLLDQTPALVGIPNIKVNVSYLIYAIESTEFFKAFAGVLSKDVGMQTIGALKK